MGWFNVDTPPRCEEGQSVACIVARWSDNGTWKVFEAHYLNRMQLEDPYGEYIYPVGWHTISGNDGDEQYDPIDVDYWQPMPSPPSQTSDS
jgi:hypothetical protein